MGSSSGGGRRVVGKWSSAIEMWRLALPVCAIDRGSPSGPTTRVGHLASMRRVLPCPNAKWRGGGGAVADASGNIGGGRRKTGEVGGGGEKGPRTRWGVRNGGRRALLCG